MAKVHLIGYTYSIFNRTQFLILVGILVLFVVGVVNAIVMSKQEEVITNKVVYKTKMISQEDLNKYGHTLVSIKGGNTIGILDLCPDTTIKLIDLNKGEVICN